MSKLSKRQHFKSEKEWTNERATWVSVSSLAFRSSRWRCTLNLWALQRIIEHLHLGPSSVLIKWTLSLKNKFSNNKDWCKIWPSGKFFDFHNVQLVLAGLNYFGNCLFEPVMFDIKKRTFNGLKMWTNWGFQLSNSNNAKGKTAHFGHQKTQLWTSATEMNYCVTPKMLLQLEWCKNRNRLLQ